MVHQYQLNGYNIVLDTCSGSVHVVDDVAYDVIAMGQLEINSLITLQPSLPTIETVLIFLKTIITERLPLSLL